MATSKAKLVWKGSKEIHLQPGFPKYTMRGDATIYRFRYRGPVPKLEKEQPAYGANVRGYPARFKVEEVEIEPDGAGRSGPGTMTFLLVAEAFGGTGTAEDETIVEIDAGGLDKSIWDNPAFAGLTKEEREGLRKAWDAKESVPGPSVPGPVSEAVAQLWERLLLGRETYLESAPVVTITRYSYTRPTVGRVGRGTRTTDKPDPAAPDGYEWLITAWKARRQGRKGKWEEYKVISAAEAWDPVTYDIPGEEGP